MRRLYIALALVMMAALAVFAFADGTEYTRVVSYSVDGYAGDETRLLSPDDSPGRGFYKFDLPEELWTVSGEAENVRRREYDGITMGCVYMSDTYGGSGGMTLTMDLHSSLVNVDEYSTLVFGIGVVGGYESCTAYTVETELVTSEGISRSSLRIGKDDELYYWSAVYTDISEVSGYAQSLSVTVRFDGDTVPSQIRVSTPFLSARTYPGFELAEKYLTSGMKNVSGRFVGATGAVIPAEGETTVIKGSIVTEKTVAEDSTVYFRVTVDGLISGRMTLGVNYTDPAKHPSTLSEKIQVSGGGVFIIPVTLSGEAYEYSLSFENVECESTFKIVSVELLSGGQSAFLPDGSVGELSEIKRQGNTVKFTGTVHRNAAKKYSDAAIVFYALTDEYTDSFSDAVEIGRIKVSTRFEYTADLAAYAASADTYMFMAALYTGGRLIPISYPMYCDPSEPDDEYVSSIGLSGAAAAGAFESNISHIIVDIPLSSLLSVNEGERTVPLTYTVYGGESKGGEVLETVLSRAVVEELDRDINFYISVGMKVYLRIDVTEHIDGLTYTDGAGNVYISADTPDSRAMYAAIVRFFSQRYASLGGFVLGRNVNGISFAEDNGDGLLAYAENLATVCAITYNTASVSHPGMTVIVPFAVAEDEEKRASDELLTSVLSDRLRMSGGIPWTLMYCIDKARENIAELCTLTDTLAQTGISEPHSVMYLYRPALGDTVVDYIEKNGGDISGVDEYTYIKYTAELFSWVTDMLGDGGVVFMEFDDSPVKTSREFYSALKTESESGGFIYESEAAAEQSPYVGAVYSIWDFSDKYHTEGWLGGGGVASCVTDYSDAADSDGGRVLKTQLAGDGYGGAGIVLGNFDNTVDLTSADSLRFTFAITGEDAYGSSSVSVVFVVGSADHRAEYYAGEIICGETTSYICDLSGYGGKSETDYIGVMIYADLDVCFELASVEALSRSADSDTLRLIFEGGETDVGVSEENRALILTAIIVAAAVSAVVIILLVRRDREDREAAERAKAETESRNRRSYYEKYRQQK